MDGREKEKAYGNTGIIEVDMFLEDVDSPDHPEAATLKLLLEQVADEYGCRLMSFDMRRGTASFSFDSDLLTAEIIKILQKSGTPKEI